MADGVGGEESDMGCPHGGLLPQEEEAVSALLSLSLHDKSE